MRNVLCALIAAATALISLEVKTTTASAGVAGFLSSAANVAQGPSNVTVVNHWRYNYWCCGAGYYEAPVYGYYYPPPVAYYPPPVVYYAPPVPRYYAPPAVYDGYDDGYVVRHHRVRYYGDW